MLSSTRRALSRLARRRSGLLAVLVVLDLPRVGLAQPPTARPQAAQPAPAPDVPTLAKAQAPPVAPVPRRFYYGAILTTAGESETGSTTVVFAPLLECAYAVHPNVLIDLAWGGGLAVDNQGLGESTTRTGNPQLSGHFRFHTGSWRFRAGLGVTAPLAHIPLGSNGRLYAFLYNQAMAMWGMWNLWFWSPDYMAVPIMGSATYALPDHHLLVIEAAVTPSIGVRGNSNSSQTLGQIAVEARLAMGDSFALCPRLQTVLLPSTSYDRWQSAVGLRATFATKAGRLFAGILINLDQPLGVFGGLERWGLQLGKEIDL